MEILSWRSKVKGLKLKVKSLKLEVNGLKLKVKGLKLDLDPESFFQFTYDYINGGFSDWFTQRLKVGAHHTGKYVIREVSLATMLLFLNDPRSVLLKGPAIRI